MQITAYRGCGCWMRKNSSFLMFHGVLLLAVGLAMGVGAGGALHAADDRIEKPFYRVNAVEERHSADVEDGGVSRFMQSFAACWREGESLAIRLDAGLATQGKGVHVTQNLSLTEALVLQEDEGQAHYRLREWLPDGAKMEFIRFVRDEKEGLSELKYPFTLSFSPVLHQAIWQKDEGRFQRELQQINDINAEDMRGRSALNLAAYQGNIAQVETLLKHKADIDWWDKDGRTPLMLAGAHPAVVRLLLKHGANASLQDKQGFDALAYAMVNPASVALLLPMLGEDKREERLANAFVWGMVKGKPKALRMLLAEGGLSPAAKHHGKSLKEWAIYHKRPDALALLRS